MFMTLSKKGKRRSTARGVPSHLCPNRVCRDTVCMQRDMSKRVFMGLFMDGGHFDAMLFLGVSNF